MVARSVHTSNATRDSGHDAISSESDVTETSTLLGSQSQDNNTINAGTDVDLDDGVDDDFAGYPWWRKPSIFWLPGPYAIFMLAFGGVIVPKLNLILDLVCRQYFAEQQQTNPNLQYVPVILGSDNPQCNIPEVQKKVATFMLILNLITGIMSAIVAPNMGILSDRYGRTKLLALASCGGLLSEIITILAGKFPNSVDYRWLILGAVCDGATGSFTAGSILTQSYTSDCTKPSKRAVALGYIYACLFTGLAVGPLLAGLFVKWTGNLLFIFYIVLGCHIFFILFVAFVVPESLSKRRRQLAKEKWKKEHQGQSEITGLFSTTISQINLFAPLKVLWPKSAGTSPRLRTNLVALAITDMIIMGCMVSMGSVIMLYSEYIFDWRTVETSMFVSSLSMVRVVVLIVIFPIINYFARTRPAKRLQQETGVKAAEKHHGADTIDLWVLRFALLSDVLGSIGYTFARTEHLFYASGMTTALGGLGSATVGSVMTKHVPQEKVGQVLGAVGMLHALSRIVGPVLFNGLYAMTVKTFPQAVFVLLTCFFVVGLLATFFIRPHVFWEDIQEENDETQPLNSDRHESDTLLHDPLI